MEETEIAGRLSAVEQVIYIVVAAVVGFILARLGLG